MGAIQGRKILLKKIKHAKRRLKERHGFFVSDHEYFQLIDQIISNKSQFIVRFSNRRTLHKVRYNKEWVPVVYSTKHQVIITTYQNKWITFTKSGVKLKSKHVRRLQKKKEERVPWRLRLKRKKVNRKEWSIK